MPQSLLGRLYDFAQHTPDRDALVSPSATLSYAQLAHLVRAQVERLTTEGISSDAVVGIRCADDFEHIILCLASTHIGATSFAVPSYESPEAQSSLSRRCGVTHLLGSEIAVSLTPSISVSGPGLSSQHGVPAERADLLFSTSGTTGEPKLVVHQDGDLVAQAHRHVSSSEERFVCVASMEHNFAKRHRLYALAMGATNVFLDTTNESLVTQSLALMVNVIHVTAFQAQDLLAQPDIHRLAHVRVKLGGSHVALGLRQQLKEQISQELLAGYGTTETGAIAFTDPADCDAGESVGQPLAGIEVRVVDQLRQTLPPGERGELAIYGAGMFRGYLGNSEATSDRLVDGWFYTGDIGYVDAQHRIHLSGRADDMFVFNSINIYPQDIESTILKHPLVEDAVVIPKASTVHGSIPVALLVFKRGVKQRLPDIEKFVQKRLGVRSPRQYIIVPEIPKTETGKKSRTKALQLPKHSDEVRHDILQLFDPRALAQLKPGRISAFKRGDEDILLKEFGMDSLARMNFLVTLELQHDTVITPKEFRRFRYLGNVVARVMAMPGSASGELPLVNADDLHSADDTPCHVRGLLRRIVRCCQTVAELNTALATLECRLTPVEVTRLARYLHCGGLLSTDLPERYHAAVSAWLQEMCDSMQASGKSHSEPFVARRVAPNARLFSAPGDTEERTLLICFTPRSVRQMAIPNATLLQHTDAKRFDLLVVSHPFETGFHWGRSRLKAQSQTFCDWITRHDWLTAYRSIRTMGFSAGARAALVTAQQLHAEMAVTVSGRFHRKRFLLKNLDQIATIWRIARRETNTRRLLSYTPDNRRDRRYGSMVAWVTGAQKIEIKHAHEKYRHLIFEQLVAQNALTTYLQQTVFADQSLLDRPADQVTRVEIGLAS